MTFVPPGEGTPGEESHAHPARPVLLAAVVVGVVGLTGGHAAFSYGT